MDTFIQSLQDLIAEKHLLTHTFYQMWERGELPQEVMQRYAEQYIHLETAFPTFLSRMHADAPFAVRQVITENQYDEEHGEENHRELWLRFGEGMGATREAMESSEMLPETREAVETFAAMSEAGYLEGTGALSAYESQIPEVSQSKVKGLKEHYGVTTGRTTQFFDVHGVMDIAHSNAWWNIIREYADTDAKREAVREGVVAGRDALWNFLTGVLREYMPDSLETEAA